MGTRHATPAVVTSMNLNGLGVARVLGRHGVPVVGVHSSANAPEMKTRYLRDVWIRDPGENGLLYVLRERAKAFDDRPALIPITDESVTTIASNLDELRGLYRIAMPEPQVVLKLLDKDGIRQAAASLGLPAPRTWLVGSLKEMQGVAGEAVFPCILKPSTKSDAYSHAGHDKAYVLDSAEALLDTYRALCRDAPRVVVQQYIPGGDDEVYFCLQYCGSDHEPRVSFTARKLRQWRPHCGGTASCERVDAPELVETTSAFFRGVKMHGLCSIEYKRDPRDGAFYMIEPTVCRTDWQNAIADINSVPIPYVAYCDLVGAPLPKVRPARSRKRWVHLEADRKAAEYYRHRGELSRLAWLWSIRPPVRGAYFSLRDPGPFLAIVKDRVRRAFRKLARMTGLRSVR